MKKETESFAETSNNWHRTRHHMPDGLWLCGVAAATPPNQLKRFILTDYFNNYNFSKLKKYAP
jgi:hypothetical protein